jgi:hypothetical protein
MEKILTFWHFAKKSPCFFLVDTATLTEIVFVLCGGAYTEVRSSLEARETLGEGPWTPCCRRESL